MREQLNQSLKQKWQEWEIPREADGKWPEKARKLHAEWWQQRIARQKEIDTSIAAKADFEYLYDKPYEDKRKVRVAGPFTVERLSPHRVLAVDENDEPIDRSKAQGEDEQGFVRMILEISRPPACSRRTRKTRSRSPPLLRGREISFARRGAIWKARGRAQRSALPSSLGRSSAPCPVPIWWKRRARPGMPRSMSGWLARSICCQSTSWNRNVEVQSQPFQLILRNGFLIAPSLRVLNRFGVSRHRRSPSH